MYASSITHYIYLLSIPCHFFRSCHVLFCYMSLVSVLTLRGMKCVGSQACTTFSYFFIGMDIALITSFLAMPIGLPIAIPAMLTHWANYLFPWVSSAHLLYFYLLLCLWAYWLSFLPCWSIKLITSFLGLPWPIYFAFTSCCAYGPVGYYSHHVGLSGLLPIFISFPFHLSLLLGFFCR